MSNAEQAVRLASALRGESADSINAILETLVEPLQQALMQPTEVVLHDLRRVPNTVRAIAGGVTHRRVGDPPTDRLLELLAAGELGHQIGYRSSLSDGRQLRCSTIIFTADDGAPAAALCINTDVSAWLTAREILDGYMFPSGTATAAESAALRSSRDAAPHPVSAPSEGEYFPKDIEELAAYLIRNAVERSGVPASEMRKEQKLQVVAELQRRGIFLVKEATETVAQALGVTRFTIYNYLNEVNGEPPRGQR